MGGDGIGNTIINRWGMRGLVLLIALGVAVFIIVRIDIEPGTQLVFGPITYTIHLPKTSTTPSTSWLDSILNFFRAGVRRFNRLEPPISNFGVDTIKGCAQIDGNWAASNGFTIALKQVDCTVTGFSPSNLGHEVNLIVLDDKAIGFVRRTVTTSSCTTFVWWNIEIGNADQNHKALDMVVTVTGNQCGVSPITLPMIRQ